MTREQYRAYLQSAHWLVTRHRILQRADGRCERCERFCGRAPHDPDVCCYEDDCNWCQSYFDEDGIRNHYDVRHLEIHHTTYERLGAERDEDLMALCEACHDHYTERVLDLSRFVGSKTLALRLTHSPEAHRAYFDAMERRICERLGIAALPSLKRIP